MRLSEFLKEERQKRCLSQREMADCIGVCLSTYVCYENAWKNKKRNQKRLPGCITARRIASFTKQSSEFVNQLIENERRA